MEILVYQSFITYEDNKQLTPEELFLYAQMRRMKSMENKLFISIDILSNMFKFLKTPKRNKNKIKQILTSLEDKGTIQITENEGFIVIEFVYFEENFDQIPIEVLEGSTPEEFMIQCFVYRFQKFKPTCSLTYDFAGKLIDSGKTKAFEVIEELVNRGRLHKIQGAKKAGSQERFPNRYFLTNVDLETPDLQLFEEEVAERNKVNEKTVQRVKEKAMKHAETVVPKTANESAVDRISKRLGGT